MPIPVAEVLPLLRLRLPEIVFAEIVAVAWAFSLVENTMPTPLLVKIWFPTIVMLLALWSLPRVKTIPLPLFLVPLLAIVFSEILTLFSWTLLTRSGVLPIRDIALATQVRTWTVGYASIACAYLTES